MFELLLGHLCGDYLLQNKFLALNKSKNTLIGWCAAIIHCLLYTFAVCLFMWNFQPIWIVAVFFSHFFIDKFSLAEWYLKVTNGRSLARFLRMVDAPTIKDSKEYLNTTNGMKVLTGGFTAIVYTVVDNTMHLVLMWGAYNLIY
jgi:hypothetical protein